MSEKVIPTVSEVRAQCAEVYATLEGFEYHPDGYTISDYPIGGANRGLCKLQAERKNGQGWRTVRTTTNKFGRWCSPKKSTYRDGLMAVVTGPGVEKEAAWLTIHQGGVYLQAANGEGTQLFKAPHWTKPRREERRYTVTTRHSVLDAGGLRQEGEAQTEEGVLAADDPALCDAYDVWEQALADMLGLVSGKLKAAREAAKQVEEAGSAA